MIAIGILGIGMLMVAATFPVGLDQTRVIAEKSTAPVVAEEAFATLRLHLDDPNPTPRVGGFTITSTPAPGTGPVTFRQAVLSTQAALPALPIPQYVSNALIFPDPTSGEPLTRPVNDWLGSPHLLLGTADTLGAATRYYPSTPTVFVGTGSDIPYTWSVLVGLGSRPNDVGVVVFVLRRSAATPVLISADFRTTPALIDSFPVAQLDPVNPTTTIGAFGPDAFNEGGFLVRAFDGQIFRVLTNEPGSNRITLNAPADWPPPDGNGDEQFWFIPADPALGRSPVVGVYVRSMPL